MLQFVSVAILDSPEVNSSDLPRLRHPKKVKIVVQPPCFMGNIGFQGFISFFARIFQLSGGFPSLFRDAHKRRVDGNSMGRFGKFGWNSTPFLNGCCFQLPCRIKVDELGWLDIYIYIYRNSQIRVRHKAKRSYIYMHEWNPVVRSNGVRDIPICMDPFSSITK